MSSAAVFGVLLWFMATALLPWDVGHRLTAALVNTGGRWKAMETPMYEADPNARDRMARFTRACPPDTTLELCKAATVTRTIPSRTAAQPTPEEARVMMPSTVAPAIASSTRQGVSGMRSC